jgi:hypothetical protein
MRPDVSGEAARLNWLLSELGEAARPAIPAMLDSARDMHAWAYLDLLDDLVNMGPVGREALPQLRRWARAGHAGAAAAVECLEEGITRYEYEERNLADVAAFHR